MTLKMNSLPPPYTKPHLLSTLIWPTGAALLLALLQFIFFRESAPTSTPATQPAPAATLPDVAPPIGTLAPTVSGNSTPVPAAAVELLPTEKTLWGAVSEIPKHLGVLFYNFVANLLICLAVQFAGWVSGKGWLGETLAKAINQTISQFHGTVAATSTSPVTGKELSENPAGTLQNKIVPSLASHNAIIQRINTFGAGPKKEENLYCRVLLLGLGGTGKTAFVDSLLRYVGNHHDAPDSTQKTGDTRIYYLRHQCGFDGGRTSNNNIREGVIQSCVIELTDYCGQTPEKFRSWLDFVNTEGKVAPINVIVFIVDLFPGSGDIQGIDYKEIHQPRIDANYDEWLRKVQSWVEINGDAAARPHYVCLYINKLDLLQPRNVSYQKAETLAKEAYDGLYQAILANSTELNAQVFAGSLKLGTHLPEIITSFKEAAEKLPGSNS